MTGSVRRLCRRRPARWFPWPPSGHGPRDIRLLDAENHPGVRLGQAARSDEPIDLQHQRCLKSNSPSSGSGNPRSANTLPLLGSTLIVRRFFAMPLPFQLVELDRARYARIARATSRRGVEPALGDDRASLSGACTRTVGSRSPTRPSPPPYNLTNLFLTEALGRLLKQQGGELHRFDGDAFSPRNRESRSTRRSRPMFRQKLPSAARFSASSMSAGVV